MSNNNENLDSKEKEQIPDFAWIFDVDVVITNPSEKRITESEILDRIIEKLEKDEPVALNTGRSLSWMIERVINPMLAKIENKRVLRNFFAVGEKGGTWLTFQDNGEMIEHKDESIKVPQELAQKIRELIESDYSDSMFYDDSKETMISTEMKDGHSLEEFKKIQKELNKKLEELIRQRHLEEELRIDPTTIATDIENMHVGKHFAIERILAWMRKQTIKPKQFITFGDSKSDIPMAQRLHQMGFPIQFIFVGNPNQLEGENLPFPTTTTKEKFDKGTLEYLSSTVG